MLSALFGLLGSVVYGASDFFGGLAAGRMHAEKVTAINSLVGVSLFSLAALVFGADFSPCALLWGACAGAVGVVALALLYACLAIGPMSILAPIMALVSAVVPMAIAFARGDRLNPAGYLGLVVGLLAVALICFVPGAKVVRPATRGILMATGAGVAVGLYLFFLDLAPADSGLAPLVLVFAVAAPLAWGAVLVRRVVRGPSPAAPVEPWWRGGVALTVYSAVTDVVASTLLLLALRLGSLAVVSVLSALSPAGTILLAALVLKERVAGVQWVGLVLAVVAAALLALA
jgi:drug/metabolite transporter (DMT)-like permease